MSGAGSRTGRSAALAVLALLVAGCAVVPAGPPAGPVPSVPWAACGGGFDCATLSVPLDHTAPAGSGSIELALVRLPAGSSRDRIGSLVVNPGGPGGSGVDFVRGAAPDYFGEDVRRRFDIVGLDPRGVGRSTAVDCGDTPLADTGDIPFPPGTDADRAALTSRTREAVARCVERTGELARHLDTASAARDLDLLRAALGEERLTYHGVSYGTFLGTTYAALFPDRVRAMVLDAPLDPAPWQDGGDELARDTTAGFHRALQRFFAACRSEPRTCTFGDGDPAGAFDRLVRTLAERPLPTGGLPVDVGLALTVVGGALYAESSWPLLADALARAEDGDGSRLRALAGPREVALAGLSDAYYAIRCSDRAARPAPGAVEALGRELRGIDPHFGPAQAYRDLPCAFWPEPASRYSGPYTAPGAPPILVVGTTGDPATPVEHARALAAELESAALLVREGGGHGAYGGISPCVDGVVDAYLLDLAVPPTGATCR